MSEEPNILETDLWGGGWEADRTLRPLVMHGTGLPNLPEKV